MVHERIPLLKINHWFHTRRIYPVLENIPNHVFLNFFLQLILISAPLCRGALTGMQLIAMCVHWTGALIQQRQTGIKKDILDTF